MAKMILVLLFLVYGFIQASGQKKDCSSEWKLVFRGVSGIGKKVYEAWTKPTPKRCKLEDGCLPEDVDLTMMKAPKKHLTSPLVGKWSTLKITKVKLELFNKGHVVMDMVFNGNGSTSTNWFASNRLLENSFDDLYSDGCQRVFTMSGNYAKRFLVAQESYLCNAKYYYWMAVVDNKYSSSTSSRFCNWENHSAYPVFLYATKHHKAKFSFSNGYETADILAIYIKTEEE